MRRVSLLLAILVCLPILAQTASTPSPVALKPAPQVVPAGANSITSQEWAELEKAKEIALKAHPEFQQKNIGIMQKIRAFQDKLSTVMLHDDPTLAPFLNHGSASPAVLPPQAH